MDKEELDHKIRFIELLLIISAILFAFKSSQTFIWFFLFAIFYYMIIINKVTHGFSFYFITIATALTFSISINSIFYEMNPYIIPFSLYYFSSVIGGSILLAIALFIVLIEVDTVNKFFGKIIKPKKKK